MKRTCFTCRLVFCVPATIIFLSFPINAQVIPPKENHLAEHENYRKCMQLARIEPHKGFERALNWQDHGGADAATHCAAVALIYLKRFKEAAIQLETMAQKMPKSTPNTVRAEIFAQASQAWLDANNPMRAFKVQSAAIEFDPRNAQLFVDRATIHAEKGRYVDAIKDLNESLKLQPSFAEALALRASAHRSAGNMAAARQDIISAISIDPTHAEALLESGILMRLAGDKDGARQDWLKLIELHEGSPAADTAKRNLEILDVNTQQSVN